MRTPCHAAWKASPIRVPTSTRILARLSGGPVRTLGRVFSIVAGILAGGLAALVAFALGATIRAAYPPASQGPASFVVYVFLALIIGSALASPLRRSESSPNAKAISAAAVITLAAFVLGHLFGFLDLDGVHRPWYIVPAGG
jgi:FtsH-binding integral membrane protein